MSDRSALSTTMPPISLNWFPQGGGGGGGGGASNVSLAARARGGHSTTQRPHSYLALSPLFLQMTSHDRGQMTHYTIRGVWSDQRQPLRDRFTMQDGMCQPVTNGVIRDEGFVRWKLHDEAADQNKQKNEMGTTWGQATLTVNTPLRTRFFESRLIIASCDQPPTCWRHHQLPPPGMCQMRM